MADLFGKMMARALNREAPPGHRPAFITGREAGVLRSLGGGVGPHGGQIMRGGIPSFETGRSLSREEQAYFGGYEYEPRVVEEPDPYGPVEVEVLPPYEEPGEGQDDGEEAEVLPPYVWNVDPAVAFAADLAQEDAARAAEREREVAFRVATGVAPGDANVRADMIAALNPVAGPPRTDPRLLSAVLGGERGGAGVVPGPAMAGVVTPGPVVAEYGGATGVNQRHTTAADVPYIGDPDPSIGEPPVTPILGEEGDKEYYDSLDSSAPASLGSGRKFTEEQVLRLIQGGWDLTPGGRDWEEDETILTLPKDEWKKFAFTSEGGRPARPELELGLRHVIPGVLGAEMAGRFLGDILGGRDRPLVRRTAEANARRRADRALAEYRRTGDKAALARAVKDIQRIGATFPGLSEIEGPWAGVKFDPSDQTSPGFRRAIARMGGSQQRRIFGTEFDEEGRPFSGARTPDDREAERQEELARAILEAEAEEAAETVEPVVTEEVVEEDPWAHIPEGATPWQREQLFPDAPPGEAVDQYAALELLKEMPGGFTPPGTNIPHGGSPEIFYNPETGEHWMAPGLGYVAPRGSGWRRLGFDEIQNLTQSSSAIV
jgi:hypothetical protein